MTRGSWRTRFGFYLLAIGSAFSLGNLWRFPFVVGYNGGGAFVLLYLLLCLIVGMPILIAELMVGKEMKSSIILAYHQKFTEIKNRNFRVLKWTGVISILLSLIILSYYSVISGWVLHFISRFMWTWLQADSSAISLKPLLDNGWMQFMLASVHVLIALILVVKGVQEGLEKWISYVMPLFAVIVLILVLRTISLPTSPEVLRFLFYPDFTKLSFSSLIYALGHVFFTLSVGLGTMVTFGSYMEPGEHGPTAGYRVALVDALVSLIALLLVYPLAFQASHVPVSDPILMFDVIPQFFFDMRGGFVFGIVFFICLYLAALNASLGLFETIVANLQDLFKRQKRLTLCWVAGLLVLFGSSVPSLWAMKIENKNFIEVIDRVLVNWILPFVVLLGVLAFNVGYNYDQKRKYFIDNQKPVSFALFKQWMWALKWFVPGIIILGYILNFMD